MKKMVRKRECELFAVRVTPQDGDMQIRKEFTDITEEFKEIFVDELPSQLPPKRDVDFEIKLNSDEPPPVRPVIKLSVDELKELKKQLQTLLQKGLIRPSASTYGALVFFVKKKGGERRMVCDYRALNKITIADSNPLPLISEAIDQVAGANIFSQLDLIGAYHQMRIREEYCENHHSNTIWIIRVESAVFWINKRSCCIHLPSINPTKGSQWRLPGVILG